MKPSKKVFVILFTGAALSGFLSLTSCKKEGPAPAAEAAKPVASAPVLSADPIYAVLGKADADVSGAADIQIGEEGITVNYHYYLAKEQEFDKTIGPHIAPKIRDLYAKVKEVDNAVFEVSISDLGAEAWKPRIRFAVDRKLIQETDWTNLLDIDFFKVVKDLKVFD